MTVVLPQLPPPGGSPQEVLFRRMLLQCSQRIQQPAHTEGTKDWRSDAKFHCIIEALQEKLYDLEHAAPDHQPGPGVLALYRTAVRAITSQLQQPQLPAYCLRVSTQDRLAGGTHSNSSAAAGAGRSRTSGEQQQQQGQQDGPATQQQPSTLGNGAAATKARTAAAIAAGPNSSSNWQPSAQDGGTAQSSAPAFSLSARAQQTIATQQRLQDDLTDELLEMGSELKSSTLAMQNAIRYRGKLLDDTETHLVHSAENAKAVAAKAKEQYRQGNWNLCHTCIIVLSVFVIFTGMLVAIRVSSMVGLKGS